MQVKEPKGSANGRVNLRRLDWRFLLPYPATRSFSHLVLLGGPAGLGDRIIEIGLAKKVSRQPVSSADSTVLLHDAEVDIREAAACLQPGGAFYCEIDRRRPGRRWLSPEKLKSILLQAGLIGIRSYAVRPNFPLVEEYLPLEAPAALRWYVSSLYPAFNLQQRLSELVLRLLTGLDGRRFAWIVPTYAITAQAGKPEASQSAFPWQDKLEAIPKAEAVYPALLTDGGYRVVLLPFSKRSTQPLAVVKIPKVDRLNARTENEQRALAEVRSRLDPDLRASIPQPLGVFNYGRIRGSLESYMPGQSLLRSCGRWGRPLSACLKDLDQAADLLASFYLRSNSRPRAIDEDEISQWVEVPQNNFRGRFGATEVEEQLFSNAYTYSRTLIGLPLAVSWMHMDFNLWNILRHENRLAVVDWEGYRPGPPLFDLLHYVTNWNNTARGLTSRREKLEGFRLLYLTTPPDSIASQVHEVLNNFMDKTGQDRRYIPLLLLYVWLELSVRHSEKQRGMDGQAEHTRSEGNHYLGYVDLLARYRDALFSNIRISSKRAG
jgi:hypothetical protein